MKGKDDPNTTTKEEVVETLSKNLSKIREFGIKRIGLFGSIVKGNLTKNSDIDILIEFKDGHETFDNLMDLYHFLKDILGYDRKIDLVTNEALSPYIGPHILKEVSYIEAAS